MKKLFLSICFLAILCLNSCSEPTVACFNYSPAYNTAKSEVNFNGSCSSNSYIFEWSFGDGTKDTTTLEPIAKHVFSAAGEYVVTLNASRKDGVTLGKNQPSISKRITIY